MELNSSVSQIKMVGPSFIKKLEKLEIKTIKDLLYHFPFRYLDYSTISQIAKANPGEIVSLKTKVLSIKNSYLRNRRTIQKAVLADNTGEIQATWFNQPFLTQQLKPNQEIAVSGKIDFFKGKQCLTSPDYEVLSSFKKTIHTGRLVPIYHETKNLSSKWLRSRINSIFEESLDFKEFIPKNTIKRQHLLDFQKSLRQIHFPENKDLLKRARKRFEFEELYLFQLATKLRKESLRKKNISFVFEKREKELINFEKKLPFILTDSQKKAFEEIKKDLLKEKPMNRLLQGDVGSGKTIVAAMAIYLSFLNKSKAVLMAPTEILANQHYQTLNKFFKEYNLKIALLTGAKKENTKSADLIIGTHALLFSKLDFSNLGLVIIDEQHRFGVEQREKFLKNKTIPHLLTMTATPIPRTIALTLHNDLDLSIIDQMPIGRKPVKTWVVPSWKKQQAHQWIKKKIISSKKKEQAFIVCPLIDESESQLMTEVKAATIEFETLKKFYEPDLKLGLIHGKLKSKEKEEVLKKFKEKKINILVSTPVIEVGIDIASASIILIESADRFGLAQLHQLRGRVGRGEEKSFCFLFSSTNNLKTIKRLKQLEKYNNGLKLAEIDLKLRGPGEVYGLKQHGYLGFKLADLSNKKLLKAVQDEAKKTKITKSLKLKLEEYKITTVKSN
jgi:ATP-dependent DNA helicase RecG